MRVYENKNWNIEKVAIKQDKENYKEEFFVDDKYGKNARVFDSFDEAKTWANKNRG